MPEKNENFFLLRQTAQHNQAASMPVLLSRYIAEDARAVARVFKTLWEGGCNTLYGFKEWFLIYKDWFAIYQSDGTWSDFVAEWAPILPMLMLNHFISMWQLTITGCALLLSTLFFIFCALSALMNAEPASGALSRVQRIPGLILPGFFIVLTSQIKKMLGSVSISSNQAVCHYYQLMAGVQNCRSLDVLAQRVLGLPMLGLSAIVLIQLANKINLSFRKWVRRHYIGYQGDRVTLSSTRSFEMAATVVNALLSAMYKSSLLQVQGGVVLYQYLSPLREGFSQYISVFSFLLTLLPSLMTDAEKMISDNNRRREYNRKVHTVHEAGKSISKTLDNVRYGDVIEIIPDESGRLLLPEACGVLETTEPVTIVYNKSGVNGEADRYTVKLAGNSSLCAFDARKRFSNDDAGKAYSSGIVTVPGMKIEKITPSQKIYFTVYPSADSDKTRTGAVDSTYHHDLSVLNTETINHLMLLTTIATVLQAAPKFDGDAAGFMLTLTGQLFRNFLDYTQMLLPLGVSALLSSEVMLYFKELNRYDHLTIEQKDKLITLLSHLHGVIDKDREVVVVSDKTGTITTSEVIVHDIIPVHRDQDEAHRIVLAAYQNLPKEDEVEENVLLEKIKTVGPVEIQQVDFHNTRYFEKSFKGTKQTTWQLGFLRDLMAAVTLVKQEQKYHLVFVFASGSASKNPLPKHGDVFLQHCDEKSRSDAREKINRFRRDWAYATCDLTVTDSELIQTIQSICAHYQVGNKISASDLQEILGQLRDKFISAELAAIAENTNELKASASGFLDHPNRHLVTGDNARACVGFSKIMFPGRRIFIYDVESNRCFDEQHALQANYSLDTLTATDLLIVSKYHGNNALFNAALSGIMKKEIALRPYLMFSDCTPESKALISRQLKDRKNKPYLVAFGDGANDAKMLDEGDFSVTCLVDGVKVNKKADFTDQEILRCFKQPDLPRLFQHFDLSVESQLSADLAPTICMMEKANPLYYAKSIKLAFAWFFSLFSQPQHYFFHLNVLLDASIYAIFSRILSRRSLSLYDAKPLSERGAQYSRLILTHGVAANVLAFLMYQPLEKAGLGDYAAVLFTAFIVPLYLKYHAQLLETYQSEAVVDETQAENTLGNTGAPARRLASPLLI